MFLWIANLNENLNRRCRSFIDIINYCCVFILNSNRCDKVFDSICPGFHYYTMWLTALRQTFQPALSFDTKWLQLLTLSIPPPPHLFQHTVNMSSSSTASWRQTADPQSRLTTTSPPRWHKWRGGRNSWRWGERIPSRASSPTPYIIPRMPTIMNS